MQIALPMIAVLFLADLGLALLTKVAPQLNAINVMFPAKIGLTLLLVGLSFPVLPAGRRRGWSTWPRRRWRAGRRRVSGVTSVSEEKTEKPTAKKRKESRKEGQVARTQELGALVGHARSSALALPTLLGHELARAAGR